MEQNTLRQVFYGWNTLSDWEKREIEDIKREMAGRGTPVPGDFGDRDVLKFGQANYYKRAEVLEKLAAHIQWVRELPPKPTLSDRSLAML